jgi:hypothetical protein
VQASARYPKQSFRYKSVHKFNSNCSCVPPPPKHTAYTNHAQCALPSQPIIMNLLSSVTKFIMIITPLPSALRCVPTPSQHSQSLAAN